MATISFKEDLIITEEETAKKIAKAINCPKKKIVAVQTPQLPKNAGTIWFKHSGN